MQDGIKDCGVASLLTIIKTYNGNLSKEYLRILTKTDNNGTNFKNLKDCAQSIGFDVKALKGSVYDLSNDMLPCIAHVIKNKSYKHFVVIHKVQHNKILIADPETGLSKISFDDFMKISTNYYLIMKPNKPIPNIENDRVVVKKLLYFFNKNKHVFMTLFLFSFVYTLMNIITSYQFQFVIEDAINYMSYNNLYFIITIFLIFSILKYISDYLRVRLFNFTSHKLDFILFKDIYSHIISLPYLYYKNRTTGEIITRINDLSTLKETFTELFIYAFTDSVLAIFVLISLFTISKQLTIITLLVLFLYLIIIKAFSKPLDKCVVNNQENIATVNSYLVESISSISTVKNLNIENETIDNMDDKYIKYINESYKFNKLFNVENLLKNLIEGGYLTIIFSLGSCLVMKNKLSLGSLITFNSLVVFFLEPIKSMISSSIYIKKAKVAINRINDLYSIKKECLTLDKKYTNKTIDGSISIKGLSYSYNGLDKIIDDMNIDINSGDKVLIAGESGCGKSTLSKIIMKYLDVSRGYVYISNKDINDYNLLELRKNISYISQNELLFTDSIYNNITLNRNIDYDSFLEVCKNTKIDKIIKNNILGYDMLLEENGCNISGGERQKIILARTLLKDSKILILDEALSQMDIDTERTILKNIFKKFKNSTVIVISHRFNNNDLFNKIIKMEKVNG